MMQKQAMAILFIVFVLCLPFLFGVFEANVGPQSNSVGTAQLRTSTGSATYTCNVYTTIAMNDYGFFPNGQCPSTGAPFVVFVRADSGTTIASMAIGAGSVAETGTIRWRYITTTDNPYWWICVNAVGVPVATWTSDDPPAPSFTTSPITVYNALNQPDPLVICRRITSSDIQGLSLPLASYVLGDAWIRAHGHSPLNREFRALQHAAGSLAPAMWLSTNLKLLGGVIVPQTILPAPVNVGLP